MIWLAASPCLANGADEPSRPELPQPEERPLLIEPTPLGAIEYRPGRGLRVGDTGFTLGGFATVAANRVEGHRGRFRLEGVDLFVFFDPTSYLHGFFDFAFNKLLDIDEVGRDQTSTADASVRRLYGDLNVSDAVNFRLGKFLTPVGRWNQVAADPLVWTTSRPLVTVQPFDGQVTGGAFSGSVFPLGGSLTYTLYGQFFHPLAPIDAPTTADKSAGGRLEFSTLRGWSAGASYVAFSRAGGWNHLGGLDAFWRADGAEVSGEFLGGRGGPDGKKLYGLYLQGVLELAKRVYGVARYERFDQGSPHRAVDLFDAGVAWRPISVLILKADYLFADRSSEVAEPGIRASISVLF